jgi:hypothetical protein
MMQRIEAERDFGLKANFRAVLWAQGYSTRVDVLLAYERDPRGRSKTGKAGLTDLDVLGVRLDPGFRVHTAIADCKTTQGQVPERLFWLSGVKSFFGSDTNFLVRSKPLPDHAPLLARSLDITLVGPDDLSILTNTYVKSSGQALPQVWQDFFSPELLSETLSRLSRLPSTLKEVELYREALYWMEDPHTHLQRIISAIQRISKDVSSGPTFQLVFADFIWLYVIALWKACEMLTVNGLSRLEDGLKLYLSGNETGLRNMQRMQRSFETLARKANVEISLSILPPYFKDLLEIIVRCARRPGATLKLARRAEWLIMGQMIGNLGPPPWKPTDDDLIATKLLGDIAQFIVKASALKSSFLDFYLDLLQDSDSLQERPNVNISKLDDLQIQDQVLEGVSKETHPTNEQ